MKSLSSRWSDVNWPGDGYEDRGLYEEIGIGLDMVVPDISNWAYATSLRSALFETFE